MRPAVVSVPLRNWLRKKPDWLDRHNEAVNRCERRENATRDHWMASSLTKEMPNGILEN
jgi:hypothetical protein